MGRNTLKIYISGIKRDFKSCVMKDSSRYCFPDRCSGPGAGEEELHLAPKCQSNGLNSRERICSAAI